MYWQPNGLRRNPLWLPLGEGEVERRTTEDERQRTKTELELRAQHAAPFFIVAGAGNASR